MKIIVYLILFTSLLFSKSDVSLKDDDIIFSDSNSQPIIKTIKEKSIEKQENPFNNSNENKTNLNTKKDLKQDKEVIINVVKKEENNKTYFINGKSMMLIEKEIFRDKDLFPNN